MDEIIEISINELNDYLKNSNWYGRENEVINLFAHTFLIKYLGKDGFTSISQIGVEVAVKQLSLLNGKKLVRKDLVIWGQSNETVWDDNREPKNTPIAVLEWKVNYISKCDGDIEWLKEFTKNYPKVTGYSICAFINDKRGVSYKKIKNGVIVT
ncbi:hypothetical protein COV23_02320 [Candidatus Wolfebacteria bacterium CG10_big_fil_rev_8_21_14_0_10_31_9]|uniref:Uncharacterized protein n=1 Tax=Candidatus Wolfebacteria bacterium CG10_big_fil_rev_8_21_14_0_10_31_9 TaxID=1975070 RepID=A0A2H0RBR3_9BACT|nr:MAG: hypothetical protein COV23_02320 [Candidatus Wolfebacteria bacterium CG10_big_fil_rev_8_21_14_0_10_31_9]